MKTWPRLYAHSVIVWKQIAKDYTRMLPSLGDTVHSPWAIGIMIECLAEITSHPCPTIREDQPRPTLASNEESDSNQAKNSLMTIKAKIKAAAIDLSACQNHSQQRWAKHETLARRALEAKQKLANALELSAESKLAADIASDSIMTAATEWDLANESQL